VTGQDRSTQRHGGKVLDIEEAKLRQRLQEIAAEHIRWGRRVAYRLLRREGWSVNHKRVQRLWREEGLQPPTPRKRKRARPADGSMRRHRAEHPHQVWAMDFQFDATADGRRLKFPNVIDEHSRLCLAIRVGRRCKAKEVVAVLVELTSLYPSPAFIRSDNGPEFIAQALRDWSEASTTTSTAYIEPGSPWENGFAESYELRSTASTTAGSGMSSSTPSCSARLPRLNCWQIAGAGSTTHSGRIRPSRGRADSKSVTGILACAVSMG
jgi:putative transposase